MLKSIPNIIYDMIQKISRSKHELGFNYLSHTFENNILTCYFE